MQLTILRQKRGLLLVSATNRSDALKMSSSAGIRILCDHCNIQFMKDDRRCCDSYMSEYTARIYNRPMQSLLWSMKDDIAAATVHARLQVCVYVDAHAADGRRPAVLVASTQVDTARVPGACVLQPTPCPATDASLPSHLARKDRGPRRSHPHRALPVLRY